MSDDKSRIDFSDLDLDWLDELANKDAGPASAGAKMPSYDLDDILKEVSAGAERSEPRQPAARPAPGQQASRQQTARQPRPAQDDRPRAQAGPSAGGRPTGSREQPQRGRSPQPRRSFADEQPVARRAPDSAEAAYEKSRGGRGRRIGSGPILIGLIVVLVLGMAFAGWQLASIFRNYHRDRSTYEELANRAIVQLAEPEEEASEQDEAAATVTGGHIASEIPITIDWDYLRSINRDIVGWLYCPDTIINYPVVQTDDQEYYLTHGFDGNSNTAGTLFADPGSVAGITQSNYIIYGHNMKDESMFGTFKNYVNRSYYEQHPTMYLLTPGGSYRIDLMCAHVAESLVTNLPGYFSSISDYQSYINTITSDAFWVDYDAVNTDRQLISLSTCTSAAGYDDARMLLYGVMVPIQ